MRHVLGLLLMSGLLVHGVLAQVATHGGGGPTSQPASSPASEPTSRGTRTSSPPKGPELSAPLKEVMRELERRGSRPIPTGASTSRPSGERTALAEGSVIRDRLSKAYRIGDRVELQFASENGDSERFTVEVLRSSWLEYLEREIDAGSSEILVTGEVTSYRGRNYFMIWNCRRAVENGNLAP